MNAEESFELMAQEARADILEKRVLELLIELSEAKELLRKAGGLINREEDHEEVCIAVDTFLDGAKVRRDPSASGHEESDAEG